ncbi:prolipoprotein diacylglyceryl transferase [Paenibacillus aurantius]|uniref:Phosphatidylglycerol--prolipoprotein diacylglyceryl transferase n=1 Tax=Paenibacillus aurantius TaxID=2918900 RepID=A0AA96LD63_9BACL|nr:prolipoprotein diacylglyceryl transferase [Paenibacillus aurantius]WNQ11033.1 prolipoprotein diacylglyceryl transferase [Paenibacillus aurantius]
MTLVIDPIAFSLGVITVRWYGIILGTAALVGLYLAVREGKRFGIIPDFFMDMMLIGVPSAIIGARLYYVAFKWDYYSQHPNEIYKIWEGGIAIYGALIGAIIGVYFYVRSKGYRFSRIADICAPGLIVGQLIGRWGNFMNQEAHGGPVEESFLRNTLHLPDFIVNQMYINGEFYHPTFLYESLWNLVGLLVLLWLRRRPFLRAGELFASYFIWYSIGRFLIEALRTDSLAFTGPEWLASFIGTLWSPMTVLFEEGNMSYGNIRVSQLLSLLIIIGALLLIFFRRKMGYAETRYADPIVSTKASPEAAAGDSVTGDGVPVPVDDAHPVPAEKPEAGEEQGRKE